MRIRIKFSEFMLLGACLAIAACQRPSPPRPTETDDSGSSTGNRLVQARQNLKTKLIPGQDERTPIPEPPPRVFTKVKYAAKVGDLGALVTPDPKDGKKHPAIIWITGGDSNTVDDVWSPADTKNDQSASAYRKAGVIMMFPSLRGGNDNPGQKETFLGEIDDVIAAGEYLKKLPYVDPERVYLGGHSTGGTIALLTAESTTIFRAIFSFGPAGDVSGYGQEYLRCNPKDEKEIKPRSPIYWLNDVKTPTWVIEGRRQGNIHDLFEMKQVGKYVKALKFIPVDQGTHFTILDPINRVLAHKILADTGAECAIELTDAEANEAMKRR